MLIGLAGKMGSGKDTIGEYLYNNYGFRQMSFAYKLKEIANDLFKIDSSHKTPETRSILQQIGTAMRCIDKDVWCNYLLDEIRFKMVTYKDPSFVITDVRFENEALSVLNHKGMVICMDVDDNERRKRIETRDHKKLTDFEWNAMNAHESETSYELIKKLPNVIVLDMNGSKNNNIEKIKKSIGITK